MTRRWYPLLVLALAAGCGDGGSGPDPDDAAVRAAAAFDALADSIGVDGHEPTAEALRHAADLVRLTGHATPVTLTIDGQARDFLAVAEQIDYPIVVCAWSSDSGTSGGGSSGGGSGGGGFTGGGDSTVVPPGIPEPPPIPEPGECIEAGTSSMRTLIAWEPESMAEVVRIVADTGTTPRQGDVPDVMTGLPTYEGDSTVVTRPVYYPGFSGEYLVRDVGSWWAVEGSQANALEGEGGACTEGQVTFDWATFACQAVTLRFEFAMLVEPVTWEYLASGARSPSDASGTHQLAMSATPVDGVKLTVVGWTPVPPEPLPPPTPVDTVTTLRLDATLEAVPEAGAVSLRLRVANPTDQAVTFEFSSGQLYDFAAVDGSGRVLWRWSADKAFTAAFESRTLQPGEALEFEERWEPGAVSGEVELSAELTSLNLPIVRRAVLEL